MADALVSIAKDHLINLLKEKAALFAGATQELEGLKVTFETIEAALADAESRQIGEKEVQLWLSRLKKVSYDMQDLLEEARICGLGEERNHANDEEKDDGNNCNCNECLRWAYSKCAEYADYVVTRYKVAHGIKEIRGRLDQINNERIPHNFISSSPIRDGDGSRRLGRSRSLTTSLVDESEIMIGRDSDKESIISQLVSGSRDDIGCAEVVALVGIGGMGKTSLARQIYHDGRVQEHFAKALYWVCVSDVFEVISLTKVIIEQVKGMGSAFTNPDSMQKELLEALKEKRFLLVLDDVWNNDPEKWKKLRVALKGAHGSKILVTTRSGNVANAMDVVYTHDLVGLNENQSWKLFSTIAFAERTAAEYSGLEKIGRGIMQHCKGVPLSIKSIGSLMKSKRTVKDWEIVLNSRIWSLSQVAEKIIPALLVTYTNLPVHLKQCFVSCSLFPKDWVYRKDMLIRLWVAQGFIQSDGVREKEDIGKDCFDDLVAWSMFQEVEKDEKGTRCKMHDLLHDLAEMIAHDEIFTFIYNEDGKERQCLISSDVRHAFLSLPGSTPHRNLFLRAAKLQTLLLNEFDEMDGVITDLFHQAKFLKALVVMGSIKGEKKLPYEIGKIKQLRYLDLSYSDIVELPESVGHLRNLHTLNLTFCRKLKKLPRSMGGMVSLKHLEIEGTHNLECMPEEIGRITSLRSLCKFIVGGGGGGCGINGLRRLNSLQGSLEIEHLERVSDREEAARAQLLNKEELSRLVLTATEGFDDEIEEKMDGVLECLQPHVNLKILAISCESISKLPSWIVGGTSSLPNLAELKISGFVYCENLPGLGKFPELKTLEISKTSAVELGHEFYYGHKFCWGAISASSFPKLEELSLRFMNELEKWKLSAKEFNDAASPEVMPCLNKLEIHYCPKLEELPHHLVNTHLSQLRIEGCDRLKWTGSSCSFPYLETFILCDSSQFLSNICPPFPNLRVFNIHRLTIETLPDRGWEQLVALQKLEIQDCKALKFLPDGFSQLQSLENLMIFRCNKLESLPEGLGGLKKLKTITFDGLEALICLPDSLGQLESLEKLEIHSLKKLQLLPEELGQLKKLQSLSIYDLSGLTYLPESLGQLDSLDYLYIGGCENVESFPLGLGRLKALKRMEVTTSKALGSLPDILQHLSLQHFKIYTSPSLTWKLGRGSRAWPKISHIPYINVNGVRIQ